MDIELGSSKNQPFLRWAGNKTRLLNEINKYIPRIYKNYHEPFLGSASVFLNLSPNNHSYLSDLNVDLINTFIQVKENLPQLIHYLKYYKNEKDEFLKIRNKNYNNPIERAAQFIYLNRTCFNGLYRVNSLGIFNVPFGYRRNNLDLIREEQLIKVSHCLKKANLVAQDFEVAFNKVEKFDLVFIDPPYTVMHNENGFIEYNQKIFSWEDQQRLSLCIKRIIDNGAYFILTNACHQSIYDLYKDICNPIIIERKSLIGGKGANRGIVKEYLFTNCIGKNLRINIG